MIYHLNIWALHCIYIQLLFSFRNWFLRSTLAHKFPFMWPATQLLGIICAFAWPLYIPNFVYKWVKNFLEILPKCKRIQSTQMLIDENTKCQTIFMECSIFYKLSREKHFDLPVWNCACCIRFCACKHILSSSFSFTHCFVKFKWMWILRPERQRYIEFVCAWRRITKSKRM